MKAYPSITTKIDFGLRYHVYDKLDGSNIRAEWNPKKGFYKFGSRTQLLTTEQENLYPSIEKIKATFEQPLSDRFKKAKFERAICFFEYHGPNSFAGSHPDASKNMKVTLIDIDVYKRGILLPEAFHDMTDDLDTPNLLYRGKLDEEMFQSVRNNTLYGITFEGVIGKSDEGESRHSGPTMFKIKTQQWLDKLKVHCNGDDRLYAMLK